MPSTITCDERGLTVELSGADVWWCFSRRKIVPSHELLGAEVVSRETARRELGWRLAGTGLGSLALMGHFAWRRRKGLRQFWHVGRDHQVLLVDTSMKGLERLVLQTPERARIAEEINASIRASGRKPAVTTVPSQ